MIGERGGQTVVVEPWGVDGCAPARGGAGARAGVAPPGVRAGGPRPGAAPARARQRRPRVRLPNQTGMSTRGMTAPRPLHIGYLVQQFPPEVGAGPARVTEMALRWQEQGARVTVITGMPNRPEGRIHPRVPGQALHGRGARGHPRPALLAVRQPQARLRPHAGEQRQLHGHERAARPGAGRRPGRAGRQFAALVSAPDGHARPRPAPRAPRAGGARPVAGLPGGDGHRAQQGGHERHSSPRSAPCCAGRSTWWWSRNRSASG